MFRFMGRKKPYRDQIIDREFPVRLSVYTNEPTRDLTWRWLERNIGSHNYATTSHIMWSDRRAYCIYFRSVFDAEKFVLGNPHIRLAWEPYNGPYR